MMTEKTVKCPICGEPYKFYPFSAADQSACPDCVRKADQKMHGREQIPDHVKKYFNNRAYGGSGKYRAWF